MPSVQSGNRTETVILLFWHQLSASEVIFFCNYFAMHSYDMNNLKCECKIKQTGSGECVEFFDRQGFLGSFVLYLCILYLCKILQSIIHQARSW